MEKTTISVQEMATEMGISLPKSYALVKEPDFPTIHVGNRILIPVEAFHEWLVVASKMSASKTSEERKRWSR